MKQRLTGLFLLCGALLASNFALAEILFRGGFESGVIYPLSGKDVDSFYYAAFDNNCRESNTDYRASNDNRVVTSPTRRGNYANAQTIHFNCDYRPLNNNKYQKPRQALKILPRSASIDQNKEYWIAFSFRLPGDWIVDHEANPDSFFQIFKESTDSSPSPRSNTANVVSILAVTDRFMLQVDDRYDSSGRSQGRKRYYWPLQKNEWQDIVINYKPCKKGTSCNGFMKVYLGNADRRANKSHMTPIYTHSGYNTLTDMHTVAVNLYKYAWHCQSTFYIDGKKYTRADYDACMKNTNPTKDKGDRTVFFDELVIGNASSSIQEVSPYFGAGSSGGSGGGGSSSGDESEVPLPPQNPAIR